MNALSSITDSGSPNGSGHPCMADLIATHPFARGLTRAQIEKIADFAMETEFARDEVIFREGDPANRFYLLREGSVALESYVQDKGQMPVQILGPGEVLGWSWLFPPYYWHFDARAIQPVKAIFLYGTPLRERCEEDYALGYQLLKRMSAIVVNRLQVTRRRLLECRRNGS
ncbi:MAG TPA: cyclic nucleotide-binding domain-containing protein, partial [Verrucomicrobiae bacterium]